MTFGEGCQYSGAIAATSSIHVTYDGSVWIRENGVYAFDDEKEAADFAAQYQKPSFTINEYWNIGQVANLVNSNGSNGIAVSLRDNAVWNVTGTSLITSLEVRDHARVIVPEGVWLTVGNTVYTDCELDATQL